MLEATEAELWLTPEELDDVNLGGRRRLPEGRHADHKHPNY